MSDEGGGGFGSFLLGVAVGAVIGMLFAPEAGQGTRRKLSRRLRDLKDLADEKADDVRRLLEAAEEGEGDDADEDDAEPSSTREELERRLAAARRRRRARPAAGTAAAEVEEEDEPVA